MGLPKKLRFEILKRDEFKCRYCGRGEGDGAKLHVDHVIAIALGGRNDPDNLATACADCNLGKSARMLDDPSVIGIDFEKRRVVFETATKSLEKYREYVKAKDDWEYSLISELLDPFKDAFSSITFWEISEFDDVVWHYSRKPLTLESLPPGYRETGYLSIIQDNNQRAEARVKRSVLYFLRALGPDQIRSAAQIAADKHTLDDKLCPQEAFKYFCGICHRMIREAIDEN